MSTIGVPSAHTQGVVQIRNEYKSMLSSEERLSTEIDKAHARLKEIEAELLSIQPLKEVLELGERSRVLHLEIES